MEIFLNLPPTKQLIIDSALTLFGANGFKKASVNDIATFAGISKAIIFHYFESKKALYLYLVELCLNNIKNEISQKLDNSSKDFFDRIRLATNIKVAVMKKHPAIISFLSSMYHETSKEVVSEIKEFISSEGDLSFKIIYEDLDTSKFKDNVNPQLVMKILFWLSEGYISRFSIKTELDVDRMIQEFDECLNLLKSNFYKEC